MSITDHIKKSSHLNQLEKYIHKYLPQLSGTVLDIGSKNRRYDAWLKQPPVAVDIIENKEKNIGAGDINNLPFEHESFDAVICFEVLEYISTPDKAIDELFRVTKKGGTVLVSVPFMYKTHDDMLRYTDAYLLHSFSKQFSSVTCHSVGNAYTVILDTIKGKINEIRFTPLRYFCVTLYLPFAYLGSVVSVSSTKYASGYFVIAKK